MECVRRVVNANDLNSFLSLPRSFMNKTIEVLITPIENESVSESEKLIEECLDDARSRYKVVNGKSCNIVVPVFLIKQLKQINYEEKPLISLRNDSVKVTMFHKGRKSIIDYKFDLPDKAFLTTIYNTENKRMMDLSELKIEKLSEFLGA